jgi:hypothetical protein
MRDREGSWMRVADSALENDETPTDLYLQGEILGRMNSRKCGDVSVVMEMQQEKQDSSSQQSIIFIRGYETRIRNTAVEEQK